MSGSLTNRKQWKGQQLDYDKYILLASDNYCSYCLSDTQAQALNSLIEIYQYKTRWYSLSGAGINPALTQDWFEELSEVLMNNCCDDGISIPPQYRFEGLVMYMSVDGGVTWEISVENDYRQNSIVWPKPADVGLPSTKCQGADSVIVTFRDEITEQVNEDMGAAAILALIAGVILLFLSAGTASLVLPQIVALASAILYTGVAAWQAAFTTEVWDDLRCMFYCEMDGDNSITQAGLDAVYADIDDRFTGIVVPTLKGYIASAGLVGINNMMASNVGDPDADCGGCDCDITCDVENWSIVTYAGVNVGSILSVGANYIIVQGSSHPEFGTPYNAMIQTASNDICCIPTSVEWLTGDHAGENVFGVKCGDPRWPASSTNPFEMGVFEMNTLFLRKDSGSNFTAKITFD